MTKDEFYSAWHYFQTLENDMDATSRFVDPRGQEQVHSFEFAKILILTCTECESIFKKICKEITGENVSGDIGTYKRTILTKYPGIVLSEVRASRLGKSIKPFEGWSSGRLEWWNAYQHVKHNRGSYFAEATYINAVTALSALYILLFYLSKIKSFDFDDYNSRYLTSGYSHVATFIDPLKQLPDFEVS